MRVFVVCAAVAVMAAASAGARPVATPGVSSDEIHIGSSVPLSGEAAIAGNVARGIDAYFKYVNDKGGVLGRKLKYTYLDDGYDPGRAVNNTIRLIQQEQVFAVFSSLGTDNNLAVRKLLNDAKVPQLYVSSGATTFGRDYKTYPWTIGYIPPYSEEGEIYGRYVVKNLKKAKIAVLYQNDDYGRDLLAGMKRALGKKAKSIVASVGYDPTSSDVQPQVTQLKASKANVLMVFAFGKFSLQAFNAVSRLGWKPQIFVNAVSSASQLMKISAASSSNATVEGSLSIVFLKDPTNPKWKSDPAMKLYRSIMAKYGQGDPNDVFNVYAMASAWTMVDALKRAGKNLTRAGLMKAVTSLNEPRNPFVLPGITIRTTPTSRFPIAQAQMQRWHNGAWQGFGPLLSARS
ncbi:MAG: ABC transporter substrate-binding protein [Gaiellaceae bacterium]